MQLIGRFYRTILEAIPLPVFLVDQELRVYRINQAAIRLTWLDPETLLRKGGCSILQCLREADERVGCGFSISCGDCVIRRITLDCIERQVARRHQMRFEAVRSGLKREVQVSVTVAPLPGNENLVLMVLEDVNEVTMLKEIIPICMHCKKIRDDQQDWHRIESYFNRSIGVKFSHGVCPECEEQYYRDAG